MNRLGLVWSCALLVACGGEAEQGAQGGAGGSSTGTGGAGGSSGAGEAGATQPSRAGVANGGGGGTGGGGGEAGAAEGGVGGRAGSPQDLALDPVVIIRGEPDAEYGDLIVRGRDLHEYEGSVVTVRIGFGERSGSGWSERLGSGQARIRQGRFELYFPQVWEHALYKPKRVYIDADADGRCTEGDPVYSDAAALLVDDTLYIPTPFPSSLETCELFEMPWPTE